MLVLGAILCVAFNATLVFVGRFSFVDGRVVKKSEEHSAMAMSRRGIAAATIMGLVALFAMHIFYGRPVSVSFRWSMASSVSVYAALFDYEKNIIPNRLLAPPLIASVLLIVIDVLKTPGLWRSSIGTYAIAALLSGGVFLVSRLVTRGGVGAGDIKLFFVLGMMLGFKGVLNVMLYTVLSTFAYSVYLLVTKRGKLNDSIPLGPFVFIGTALSVAFGA